MSKELDAGPVTLLRIFKGEREYRSPLFQRQYIWNKEQIDRLWSDIDSITNEIETTKFLGAIVLEIKSSGSAFKPDSYWIIDGQQRLTTLYMTILHLAIEAEKSGHRDLSDSLYNQYLFNQDGIYRNQPKLITTLQDNTQFAHLFTEIRTITPILKQHYGEETGILSKGNELTKKKIKERCFSEENFDYDKTKKLIETLLEKLKFVQIILGDDQEPQQVYDALNTTGIKLGSKDIIRNKVFQRISDYPDRAIAIYDTHWIPLENDLKISNQDRFEDYLFPFALVHKPTITKSNLVSALTERWKEWEPEKIVHDLRVFLPSFIALKSDEKVKRETLTNSREINNWIEQIYKMRAPSSVYPFIFRLINDYNSGSLDEASTINNLKLIESFMVRRAFAGFEPTGLHAVFKDLYNKTNGTPQAFIDTIDQNPTVQFPDDDKFEQDIRYSALYGRKLAKYILETYERDLRGGDPYPESINITIDHIMPQQLTDEWRRIIIEDQHEKYLHVWANLVPLSGQANSERGRQSWESTRDFYLTETVFKTTKRLAQDNESWTIDSIINRSDHLVSWAINRWQKSG